MTTDTMFRLTGGALIASFAFSLAGGVTHPIIDGESHSVAALTAAASPYAQIAIYVGALFLMVGLPGMFAWLSGRIGRIGLAGAGLYMLGNALSAQSHLVVEAFAAPAVARDPAARHLIPDDGTILDSTSFAVLQTAGGLVLIASLLLLGIGLLRSDVVPRWVGAVLTIGALLLFVPFPEVPGLTGILIEFPRGLAVAMVGAAMIRVPRRSTDTVPAPVAVRARQAVPA